MAAAGMSVGIRICMLWTTNDGHEFWRFLSFEVNAVVRERLAQAVGNLRIPIGSPPELRRERATVFTSRRSKYNIYSVAYDLYLHKSQETPHTSSLDRSLVTVLIIASKDGRVENRKLLP